MSTNTIYKKSLTKFQNVLVNATQEMSDNCAKKDLQRHKKDFHSPFKRYREWREELSKVCPEIHNENEMGYADNISVLMDTCNYAIMSMLGCLAKASYDGWFIPNLDWNKYETSIKRAYDNGVSSIDLHYATILFLKPEFERMLEEQGDADSYEADAAIIVEIGHLLYVYGKESIKRYIPDSLVSHERKMAIENAECNRAHALTYTELFPKCFDKNAEIANKALKDTLFTMMSSGFSSFHLAATTSHEWTGRFDNKMVTYLSVDK